MRAVITDTALAIGASFAASLLFKVTLILGVALISSRLARRSRAAVRHVLLAAGFAALLVLPPASLVIPSLRVEVPAPPVETIAVEPAASQAVALDVPGARPDRADAAVPVPLPALTWDPASSTLWAAVWAIGALLTLAPMIVGMWQMRTLRRSGLPWPRGRAIVRQLAAEAGCRRRIDVQLHESMAGPMTCGVVRPTIVLPSDAQYWTAEDLRHALIHEMEHVRRADWASQCLARTICAVYWFHPLVWIARRRLSLEAERACDDAVLGRADAAAYADQLVLLAQRLSTAASQPLLAMATCRDLTTRVRAVLDSAQTRGRAGAVCVATAAVAAAMLVTMIAPLRAVPQAPQPALTFEAATVKPNKSGEMRQLIRREPGGRFVAENMPLRALITFAYQIQGFQLVGGPDWITSDHFDINAKADSDPPPTAPWDRGPNPLRQMLQSLLADRFKLKVHTETRELPLFELVMARDGKPGPQLRQSSTDCAALMGAAQAAARSGGAPPQPPSPDAAMKCGIRMTVGRINFGGSPMSALADSLSPLTQRIVVDRTGLTGLWDFELAYTPDPGQAVQGPPPPGAQAPTIDPNGPTLVTALEEQLGLKLQSARGAVEVLVIDSVDHPGEN